MVSHISNFLLPKYQYISQLMSFYQIRLSGCKWFRSMETYPMPFASITPCSLINREHQSTVLVCDWLIWLDYLLVLCVRHFSKELSRSAAEGLISSDWSNHVCLWMQDLFRKPESSPALTPGLHHFTF